MLFNYLIKNEIDYIKQNAHFTDEETVYFDMKTNNKTNIQIAMQLNVSESTVSRISKRVRTKYSKVINISQQNDSFLTEK